MELVKITLRKTGGQHLGLVKAIKFSTDLGLKEAKEFCDRFRFEQISSGFLVVKSVSDLRMNLEKMTDWEFIIDDTKRQRMKKLVAIGIGSNQTKIDILTDEVASKLYQDIQILNSENMFLLIKEHFSQLMKDIDDDSIGKLYEKYLNEGKSEG